jgi:hypothetical protein
MPRHRKKAKTISIDDLVTEEVNNELSKDILLNEINDELSSESVENILDQDPLYTDASNIEDMILRNNKFYEKTSEKIFKTMLKEEQVKLKELTEAEYYPIKREEEPDNFTLMKIHLNIVR